MNDMNMTPAQKSRVYALADAQGRVTRIEGEYSLPADLTGWVKIDEGAPCDRLNLAQSHYLPQPLYTTEGVLRYKLKGNNVVERTEEEIAADVAARPGPAPSQLDRLEAQTTYTALMTDTLLEEG